MNVYRFMLSLMFSVIISGCATFPAGPFITDIKNDGRGGLMIEKCTLSIGEFFSKPETRDCTTSQIVEVGGK